MMWTGCEEPICACSGRQQTEAAVARHRSKRERQRIVNTSGWISQVYVTVCRFLSRYQPIQSFT